MSGGSKKQTVGYRYLFGLHMGIGRGPVDELCEIKVGDKQAWQGSVTGNTTINIDAYNLFGGEDKEGGVQGTLEVMMGGPTQTASGGLLAMLGSPLPGFRRMLTVFFDGIVTMTNPYPKPWKFRLRRVLAGWDGDVFEPGLAVVAMAGETSSIYAMNGAHIIYECMTNREWGRGLNRSRLHTASFTAAATQLKAEGFGLCLKWTRKDSIESFVQSVLNHIGAVLFPDRTTGLLKLTLIRGGYDFAAMTPYTTENGIIEITEATTGGTDKAVNSVTVTYHDQGTDEDRTITVGNLANLQSSGGVINSSSQEYTGVPTAALASRLAQRDLRASSTSLKRFTLSMDRRAYAIEPGSVIAIEDTRRGIPKTPVRVARIEEGSVTSGRVTITAVQDVFAIPSESFVSSVPPSWSSPNNEPCIDEQLAFELPYFLLARGMSPGDLAVLDENAAFVGAFCSQGQPMNAGFSLAVRDGAPTLDDEPPDTSYNC